MGGSSSRQATAAAQAASAAQAAAHAAAQAKLSELENEKSKLQAQLHALQNNPKDPGKRKQIAGMQQTLKYQKRKLKKQIADINRKEQEIKELQGRHGGISVNHSDLARELKRYQTSVDTHLQDVQQRCWTICDQFYKLANEFVAASDSEEKRHMCLMKMHGLLTQLDTFLKMHGSKTHEEDPCCFDAERAHAIMEKMATHVLCMWDFVQDVAQLQEDAASNMVKKDVRDVDSFLRNRNVSKAFSDDYNFRLGMDMLEKRLIKMKTEQSDYMKQVVSSSHVMTEGLLKDVRMFVATVLRYSMGERAARQATVDVSFTIADKKQFEVVVQLPSTEAEENEQQSPVMKNNESSSRKNGPPAPPPPPPPGYFEDKPAVFPPKLGTNNNEKKKLPENNAGKASYVPGAHELQDRVRNLKPADGRILRSPKKDDGDAASLMKKMLDEGLAKIHRQNYGEKEKTDCCLRCGLAVF